MFPLFVQQKRAAAWLPHSRRGCAAIHELFDKAAAAQSLRQLRAVVLDVAGREEHAGHR